MFFIAVVYAWERVWHAQDWVLSVAWASSWSWVRCQGEGAAVCIKVTCFLRRPKRK